MNADNIFFSLVIDIFATSGALISATFVVYGYLLSVRSMVEAQKPKILIRVANEMARILTSGEIVHQTRINYKNIGTVECEDLMLQAALVRDDETIDIPRIFALRTRLQVGDERDRTFPTIAYLQENGVPQAVIQNLSAYQLRIGYTVKSIEGPIERSYEYRWDSQMGSWNIL